MSRPWPLIAGFALAFFVITSLTIAFTRYGGGFALVWFGSAIAAMMLVRLPRPYWMRGLLAIMAVSALATSLFGFGPHMAAPLALLNAFEAWLLARVLLAARPQRDWLDCIGGLTTLIGATVFATGIAAFFGGFVAGFAAPGGWGHHAASWWAGHGLGTLIGFPIAYLVSTTPVREWLGGWSRPKVGELALHLGSIALVTYYAMNEWLVPILFLPIVPLLFAAFRCGREGATLGLLVIAAMSALLADQSSVIGSLDTGSGRKLLFIQFYLTVLSVLAIPASVALRQYELVLRELEERKALKLLIAEHSDDALLNLDTRGRIRYGSPAASRLSGREALEGEALALFFDPLDEPAVTTALADAAAAPGETVVFERPVVRGDDQLWLEARLRAAAHEDDPTKLIGFAVTIRDVTARKLGELDALHAAETDALTGLPNRRALLGVLERALAEADKRPFTIAILDLDHFKAINDGHGHLAGDHVLREVAAVMRRLTTPGRVFARIGGEEFAIVSREGSVGGASLLCERLRAEIAALRFVSTAGESFGVTASIGCAQIAAKGTAAHALAAADALLYHAKRGGRNRVETGTTQSERRSNRRAA